MKRIFVCSFLVGMGLFLSACPKPVCGDGVVDAELGEACDDGNNIDADGCEADCSLPACENGIQDPGEICFVAKTFDAGLESDPNDAVLGDFNEDGLLDFASAHLGAAEVGIFLNLGEEQFAEPIRVSLASLGPNDIVAEDFNQDGHLDLATTNGGSDDVSLLFGAGDGQFVLENTFIVGDGPSSLLAGRFDNGAGPGLASIDLVIGNLNSFDITVLFNDGVGNFSEAPDSPLALPGRPEALASGDFDNDGDLDFAVSSQVPDEVNIFFGGGLDQFAGPFLLTDQILPSGVSVGDLDQDGTLDVLVTTDNTTDLEVFLGQGGGDFLQVEPLSFEGITQNTATSPVLVDLDGDGFLDIVTANFETGILVLLGQGGGQFSTPIVFEAGFALALQAGDLNGDSLLDLVVPNGGEDRITVLFSAP